MTEIMVNVEECYIRMNTECHTEMVEHSLKGLANTLVFVDANNLWHPFIHIMKAFLESLPVLKEHD